MGDGRWGSAVGLTLKAFLKDMFDQEQTLGRNRLWLL